MSAAQDTVDRRLEDRFAAAKRIAAGRRVTRGRTGRSRAATSSAVQLLRWAFPERRFEVVSGSFDEVTIVTVTWAGMPTPAAVKKALVPLTVEGGVRLDLTHESEFARRHRLASRAAYWALRDLTLTDTPETLARKLVEKLTGIIPAAPAKCGDEVE
jgi:hypothetical protein